MKCNSRIILLLLCMMFTFVAYAQQKSVSGVVIDDTNAPLPGVAVTVPGTTKGVITDFDGRYNININDNETQLSFSFIGFITQVVDVNGQSTIDIKLESEMTELDDIVVVGYGTMKKSDISGASVSVTAEDIKDFVGSGIDQALQGRAAGVAVTANSGQPGAGMQVQIRGASTLNAKDAQPLYVIDGVPVQSTSNALSYGLNLGNGETSSFSALSNLSPEDIESMEILKDASATAIYGSRAANGVVLITTKNGKKGKAQFEYNGSFGYQNQGEMLDLMNLREFAKYRSAMAEELDIMNPSAEYQDYTLLGEGTDWQDAIFRTAFMQSHSLSASGGTENVRYYISGGYYDQEGTIIGSAFDRYNFRVNIDANVTEWMKVGANTAYSVSKDKLIMNNSEDGIISLATWSTPDIPVYDMDGNYASVVRDGYSFKNPVAEALSKKNELKRRNIDATVYAEIKFLNDFVLRSEYSLNDLNTNSYAFNPTYDYGNVVNTINSATRGKFENTYWQVKNYLTYNKTFLEDHSLTFMVGQETSEWAYENVRATGSALSSNEIDNPSIGTGTPTIQTGWGSGSRVSLFGRLFYGFKNRYNLTATFRRDGSSNFGPSNRWGNFFSGSASWKFIDESIFESIRHIVNNGRLRLGWGQVGNDNIGGFAWGATGTSISVGQMGKGYQVKNIANESISWETQESINIGLDLGFLENRIQFVAEYYQKTSKDMLMTMQLPSYMGTEGNASYRMTAPKGNFGEMTNKGVEISITSANISRSDFKWTTTLQFSHNKNELVSLKGSGNSAFYGRPQWDGVGEFISITKAGEPLYQFYGYKTDGLYQNYSDLLNSPKPEGVKIDRSSGVYVGDVKFKDLYEDGKINEQDMTVIGDPNPDFTAGMTNEFSYKGFDLSIFLTASYGNDVFNYNNLKLTQMSSLWNNQLEDVNDHAVLVNKDDVETCYISNANTDMPRIALGDPAKNSRHSDRYIEDGSYLKIKSISLAYNFPKSWLSYIHVKSAKLSANVSNVYTFTNYTGMDPEVGVSQTTQYVSGVDIGRYPSPRIITFGLNLQF